MDQIIPFICTILKTMNFNLEDLKNKICETDIDCHNGIVVNPFEQDSLELGDHIYVNRVYNLPTLNIDLPYTHHGIVTSIGTSVEDIMVTHPVPNPDNAFEKGFKTTSLVDFISESTILKKVVVLEKRYPFEIVKDALSYSSTYNIFTNNCETFANTCQTGTFTKSKMVDIYCKIINEINPMLGSIIMANIKV